MSAEQALISGCCCMDMTPEKSAARWGGPRANAGGPRPNSGGSRPGSGRPRKVVEPVIVVIEDPGAHWCVLQTQPQAEESVAREIARRGTPTYCPLTMTRQRDKVVPTMTHKVLVPMIRGYVFVHLDVRDPWGWMRDEVRGARDFLTNSFNRPASLPDAWVEKEREKDAERLELKDSALPPDELKARAHPSGTRVLIELGTYVDLPGTVLSCDGMTSVVEICLLGRTTAVERPWDRVVILKGQRGS